MATYKVKQGDNLSKIANSYGTTVNAIANANNISNPDMIYAGNNLTIPGTKAKEKEKAKTPTTNPTKTVKPTVPKVVDYNKNKPKDYTQSNNLQNMYGNLTDIQGNAPGEYNSSYQSQIDSLLGQIQNRPDFAYDMNADALYNQYKDQYQKQGQMAMLDTMGNAAALSGGYGNSYATTAGNQAYQSSLQDLNNVVPELYNAAYNRYASEGSDMYNQANLLQGVDQSAYGRYRDDVADYNNELAYATDQYNNAADTEYGQYQDKYNAWNNDRSFNYGSDQDKKTFDYNSSQDKKNYNYQAQQDKIAQQNYLREFAYQQEMDKQAARAAASKAAASAAKKSSGGSSKKSSSNSYSNNSKGSSNSNKETSATTKQYNSYNVAATKKIENAGSLEAGVDYIDSLYDSGKISGSQYKSLYKSAKTVSQRARMTTGSLIVN